MSAPLAPDTAGVAPVAPGDRRANSAAAGRGFVVLDTLGKLKEHRHGLVGHCAECAALYWKDTAHARPSSFDIDLDALIAERGGKFAGYLLGRDGRVMNQLGPLVAEDDVVAIDLLARAIGSISATIAIDLPDRHVTLRAWLTSLGFAAERPLTRMAYGTKDAFDDAARLFAIAGPELG